MSASESVQSKQNDQLWQARARIADLEKENKELKEQTAKLQKLADRRFEAIREMGAENVNSSDHAFQRGCAAGAFIIAVIACGILFFHEAIWRTVMSHQEL